RAPAQRLASSTAVETPANPPPTMSTRGASDVERRARTRPIGLPFIIVLETRVHLFRFAGKTPWMRRRSGGWTGGRPSQDHAGAVQPRLHRRDWLTKKRRYFVIREVLDVAQDEHHAVVVRKAIERLLQHSSSLAGE